MSTPALTSAAKRQQSHAVNSWQRTTACASHTGPDIACRDHRASQPQTHPMCESSVQGKAARHSWVLSHSFGSDRQKRRWETQRHVLPAVGAMATAAPHPVISRTTPHMADYQQSRQAWHGELSTVACSLQERQHCPSVIPTISNLGGFASSAPKECALFAQRFSLWSSPVLIVRGHC